MSRLKLVFLLFIFSGAQAQQKYWVFHPSLNERDPNTENLKELFCSDWINACSYYLTEQKVSDLKDCGLLVLPVNRFYYQNKEGPPRMGFALEQIKGQLLHEAGLNGKDVKIGVIDGGFSNIHKDPSLQLTYQNNQIMAFRDYIRDTTPTDIIDQSGDTHGTEVLQLIAGYHPEKKILFGLATHAIFYLARTDFDGYEKRIEEDNLIAAMEWMHEEGVKIINISLGYTRGYNDKSENYNPDQMDGQTSAVAKAVEYAANEKGMLIVVAAGNEASDFGWNVLSTPADAEHALTVGSSQLLIWDKAGFSSIGPDFLNYIKPDVVVFSGSGTSFSAPVITGLAACIQQFDSTLTNHEIINIIKKSGHLYPYPNNYTGFGVPLCENILNLLKKDISEVKRPEVINARKNRITIPISYEENRIVLLHKDIRDKVIKRSVIRPKRSIIKVKRLQMAQQTTLLYDHSAKEIIWESSR